MTNDKQKKQSMAACFALLSRNPEVDMMTWFMHGTRPESNMCAQVVWLGQLATDLLGGAPHVLILIRWGVSEL